MKIKELIEKLQDSAARYGPGTDVVLVDIENGCLVCVPVSAVGELSDLGDVAYPYVNNAKLPAVVLS